MRASGMNGGLVVIILGQTLGKYCFSDANCEKKKRVGRCLLRIVLYSRVVGGE